MRRANRGVNNLSQPRGLQHPATARKLRGSPQETGNQARQERNGLPRFSCTARPHTPSRTVGRVAQAHGRSAVCRGACGRGFRSRLLATAPRSCPTGKFPRPDSYGAATVSDRARIRPSRCGAPGNVNLQARAVVLLRVQLQSGSPPGLGDQQAPHSQVGSPPLPALRADLSSDSFRFAFPLAPLYALMGLVAILVIRVHDAS